MSINIIQAAKDKNLFASFFGPSWNTWIIFLAALFALPMTPEQQAIYTKHTGRTTPPAAPAREGYLVVGRRGGKSFILAVIAVFLAAFFDWRPFLGPGEFGTIMIVAADRRQARVIMRYVLGLLEAVPMLNKQIEHLTKETVTLKNRIVVEIHTASFRSTRGYTIIAALMDEIAYWPTDETASEPDVEVLNAVKPGMATIPKSLLLCASSPYSKRGALYEAHRRHYGHDGDPILVWRATTRDMNATVPQSFIDQHMQEDEPRARAEYLAEFRQDIEGFVSREAVMACVSVCIFERAKEHYKTYHAFCDPSGGSSDGMTLAIAHRDIVKKIVVIDCLREIKAPFSPEAACSEFALVCKSYGIGKITGDRYGGQWPTEQFGKFGIRYEACERPKSDLYVDLLALLNSRRIELLDSSRVINQLCGLERRTARSGKDSIDHPPGQKDDLANAVAGVASICNRYGGYNWLCFDPLYKDPDDPGGQRQTVPPEREPVQANGNWWKSMPRSDQKIPSGDDRLRAYYQQLDIMFRGGFLK